MWQHLLVGQGRGRVYERRVRGEGCEVVRREKDRPASYASRAGGSWRMGLDDSRTATRFDDGNEFTTVPSSDKLCSNLSTG